MVYETELSPSSKILTLNRCCNFNQTSFLRVLSVNTGQSICSLRHTATGVGSVTHSSCVYLYQVCSSLTTYFIAMLSHLLIKLLDPEMGGREGVF